MPFQIAAMIEVDTEYESEAHRVSHFLADVITDMESVKGVSMLPPIHTAVSSFDGED